MMKELSNDCIYISHSRALCSGAGLAPVHVCMTSLTKPATRALAGLGRATYVFQRGVEDVLQELHAAGLLDAAVATSCSSVKRARDDESESWSNSYGHMI